jgi:hypothetical protein
MKRDSAHLNPPIRRRALVLLASCPDGCTKAVLAAHNIPDDIVQRLIRSGLAVAHTEAIVARPYGGRSGREIAPHAARAANTALPQLRYLRPTSFQMDARCLRGRRSSGRLALSARETPHLTAILNRRKRDARRPPSRSNGDVASLFATIRVIACERQYTGAEKPESRIKPLWCKPPRLAQRQLDSPFRKRSKAC